MTGEIRIRPCTAADEPLLWDLFCENKAPELAIAGLGAAQLRFLLEMQFRGRQQTYAALYPDAEDSILEDESGQPVGRLLLDRRPERWRIVDIAVAAPHRRKGIATGVLRTCQQQCGPVGARLELEVALGNSTARLLYARLGFQQTAADAVSMQMAWPAAPRQAPEEEARQ